MKRMWIAMLLLPLIVGCGSGRCEKDPTTPGCSTNSGSQTSKRTPQYQNQGGYGGDYGGGEYGGGDYGGEYGGYGGDYGGYGGDSGSGYGGDYGSGYGGGYQYPVGY